MGLTLTIENETRLPDGGPLSFTLPKDRSADIGRDAHLDWTLPDPTRHISGKHCEINCRDGDYWLTDVSTNGTYLNGSDRRVQSPHRLRSDDRLTIGRYIIAVEIVADVLSTASWTSQPGGPDDGEDLWSAGDGVAPPIDPRELRPASQNRPVKPDFLEWAVDVPNAPGVGFVAKPAAAQPRSGEGRTESWDAGELPQAPRQEPEAARPVPRRGVWVGVGPEGAWGGMPEVSPDAEASRAVSGAPDGLPPADRRIAAPAPEPAAAADRQTAPSDIVARFARGAGLPADALATEDPGQFAERLGRLMLLVADNLKQLLQARSQAKRIVRSSSHTIVSALDNNPLKFAPAASDAVRLMLGPRTGAYLEADDALRQSFADLKSHQIRTFSAMQRALDRLLADLDPAAIEAEAGKDLGFVDKLGSRRGRLWARYEALWAARSRRDGGMREQFMQYFAECYDEPTNGRESGDEAKRP